jgi:hypothetical protein
LIEYPQILIIYQAARPLHRGLKNTRLPRYAASLVNRRTSMYASFLVSCAPCIRTFLNSLLQVVEKYPPAACHLQVMLRGKPRVYASFLDFCAPCIRAFLNSLFKA